MEDIDCSGGGFKKIGPTYIRNSFREKRAPDRHSGGTKIRRTLPKKEDQRDTSPLWQRGDDSQGERVKASQPSQKGGIGHHREGADRYGQTVVSQNPPLSASGKSLPSGSPSGPPLCRF